MKRKPRPPRKPSGKGLKASRTLAEPLDANDELAQAARPQADGMAEDGRMTAHRIKFSDPALDALAQQCLREFISYLWDDLARARIARAWLEERIDGDTAMETLLACDLLGTCT
jgi:hypothetical protein